jgi:hypothetical protein
MDGALEVAREGRALHPNRENDGLLAALSAPSASNFMYQTTKSVIKEKLEG